MLWDGGSGEVGGENNFHVYMASPPSTISHHLPLFENSLKFSADAAAAAAVALKQYEREDRSVSNNDDVVHVPDKARHPQRTESEGTEWRCDRWSGATMMMIL